MSTRPCSRRTSTVPSRACRVSPPRQNLERVRSWIAARRPPSSPCFASESRPGIVAAERRYDGYRRSRSLQLGVLRAEDRQIHRYRRAEIGTLGLDADGPTEGGHDPTARIEPKAQTRGATPSGSLRPREPVERRDEDVAGHADASIGDREPGRAPVAGPDVNKDRGARR